MARILMVNLPYAGHTNPTLALAEDLVRHGHQVAYVNAPEWRTRIEATGATFVPYVDYPEGLTTRRSGHGPWVRQQILSEMDAVDPVERIERYLSRF